MMTTLTRSYAEGFAAECARLGLTSKQASILLWRQRMDEAMECPAFRKGFEGELAKHAGSAPSLVDQVAASMADRGSLAGNVGHYGGRGGMLGALGGLGLTGLSLLARKPAGVAKGLARVGKGLAGGAAAGGVLGGAGGFGKWLHGRGNNLKIDAMALSPTGNPVPIPGPQPGAAGGGRDPYSYMANPAAPGSPGVPSGPVQGPQLTAASDWVRVQQGQLGEYDRRIAQLEQQMRDAERAGTATGTYSAQAGIADQIAHVRAQRDERQRQINDSLWNLREQQFAQDKAISRELPRVTAFTDEMRNRAQAAKTFRSEHGTLSKFLQWLGGQPQNQDPVYNYLRRLDAAGVAKGNMERAKQNPAYYR